MVLILGAFAWGLGSACQWEKSLCSAFILSVIMQNSGNLGISINRFAFGEHASEIAVLHYTLMQITANTIGIFIIASGSLPTSGSALRGLTKTPLIYATLLAIASRTLAIDLPSPLLRAVELTAGAAVPVMLVILGIQLAKLNIGDDVAPISLAIALRLIIAPLLALALATTLGISVIARTVSVIQWGLPTAVTVSILALQYDCRPQYAAGVIFCTTMAGVLTVSVMLTWFMFYTG
jgi:predicted permease